MKHTGVLVLFLNLIIGGSVYGQTPKSISYYQEIQSLFSTTGEIPFWMRANQYGIVPRGQTVNSLRSAWRLDYRDAPRTAVDSVWERTRKTDWGWGVDAVGNVGSVTRLVVPEAYVKAKVGPVEGYAGRRREVFGLGGGAALSSGSFAWSGNALPLFKVQVAIPDFWPANSALSVKGSFAHGWFNNGFVQNSLLHQKTLYVRIGKPASVINLYAGFNHQVQWAGRTKQLGNEFIRADQFPSSLRAYWWVVSGASLNTRDNIDTTLYSNFDRGNRVGNHLGTVDVGAEVKIGQLSVLLYRQNLYEDGSLFYLINIADGLNGLRIRNRKVGKATGLRLNEIVVEYLNTFSQGGSTFVEGDPKHRGRDDYFNHGQYRDGWSYKGRTIGTPFIAPATDLRADLPQYAFTNNNRISVYHAGLSGQISDRVTFLLKASYSQNAGTYQVPFAPQRKQRSAILATELRLGKKGFRATASGAVDRGDLYTSNTGFSVGLLKRGKL